MRCFLLLFVFFSTLCFAGDESFMLGSMESVKLGMTLKEIMDLKKVDNILVSRQDPLYPHSFDAFADTQWQDVDLRISMLFDCHNNDINENSNDGLKCVGFRPLFNLMNDTYDLFSERKSVFVNNVIPEFLGKCIAKWGNPTEKFLSVRHDSVIKNEHFKVGYLLWEKNEAEILLKIINHNELRDKPVNDMSVCILVNIYIYDPSFKSYLYSEEFLINEDEIITDQKQVAGYFKGLLKD